ncbi:hypothetical protein ABLE91_27860 [Aquabacter sp. CN5-332]|uniref:hypothetical protein n=1 Tax=Aquabacter sp. CN5-332 TaxID=3156608 RepID=UPI0032B515B7
MHDKDKQVERRKSDDEEDDQYLGRGHRIGFAAIRAPLKYVVATVQCGMYVWASERWLQPRPCLSVMA